MSNPTATSDPSNWPFLALVLAWVVGDSSLLSTGDDAPGGMLANAVFMLGAGASIGLHELAPRIFGRLKAPPGSEPRGWRAELASGALGLGVNLAVAVAALVTARLVYQASGPDAVVRALAAVVSLNLVLTVMNILPSLPMDGGRILCAIVSGPGGRPIPAIRLTAALTEITGWLIVVSGVALALSDGLTAGIPWLLIGGLVLREASLARRKLDAVDAPPQPVLQPRLRQRQRAQGWRGGAGSRAQRSRANS